MLDSQHLKEDNCQRFLQESSVGVFFFLWHKHVTVTGFQITIPKEKRESSFSIFIIRRIIVWKLRTFFLFSLIWNRNRLGIILISSLLWIILIDSSFLIFYYVDQDGIKEREKSYGPDRKSSWRTNSQYMREKSGHLMMSPRAAALSFSLMLALFVRNSFSFLFIGGLSVSMAEQGSISSKCHRRRRNRPKKRKGVPVPAVTIVHPLALNKRKGKPCQLMMDNNRLRTGTLSRERKRKFWSHDRQFSFPVCKQRMKWKLETIRKTFRTLFFPWPFLLRDLFNLLYMKEKVRERT